MVKNIHSIYYRYCTLFFFCFSSYVTQCLKINEKVLFLHNLGEYLMFVNLELQIKPQRKPQQGKGLIIVSPNHGSPKGFFCIFTPEMPRKLTQKIKQNILQHDYDCIEHVCMISFSSDNIYFLQQNHFLFFLFTNLLLNS